MCHLTVLEETVIPTSWWFNSTANFRALIAGVQVGSAMTDKVLLDQNVVNLGYPKGVLYTSCLSELLLYV